MSVQAEKRTITILATGLTSGIGLETLKLLVANQLPSFPSSALSSNSAFRIIIGARSPPSSIQIETDILSLRASPRTFVHYESLDLASPASVEDFPARVQPLLSSHLNDGAQTQTSVDIVLFCAGTTASAYRSIHLPSSGSSGTDVEETVYVNVLAQARILHLLLEKKMLSPTARISFVNSGLHARAAKRYPTLSPASLATELSPPKWASMKAYEISKLLEMHLAFVVKDRLEAAGAEQTVVSVRPGFIPTTGLFRNVPWYGKIVLRWLIYWLPFVSTERKAGEVILRTMFDSSESVPSGAYVSKDGLEKVAPECGDPAVRAEWAKWFTETGTWANASGSG